MADKIFVSFVLDETGSMQPYKRETIKGYNKYIKELKVEGKKTLFTLTQFNSEKLEIVCDALKLKDVPKLTDESYRPASLTPLYDAMATAIKRTSKKAADAPVLFVVMTDGEENASEEHTFRDIQKLIKKKEKKGWTLVYLGANQDAWAVGTAMGIPSGNTMNYAQAKTAQTMSAMAASSRCYLASGGAQSRSFWVDGGVDADDLS